MKYNVKRDGAFSCRSQGSSKHQKRWNINSKLIFSIISNWCSECSFQPLPFGTSRSIIYLQSIQMRRWLFPGQKVDLWIFHFLDFCLPLPYSHMRIVEDLLVLCCTKSVACSGVSIVQSRTLPFLFACPFSVHIVQLPPS